MTSSPTRRPWQRVLMASALVAATLSVDESVAWAAVDTPLDVGDVMIVDANDHRVQLSNGDSDTQFSLRLPDGSTCPGDSANDQWRTQSFIIPSTDDPVAIQYGAIGPEPVGNGRYAMFMVDTRPYVHQLTRPNPGVGEPGVISAIPPLSFAVVAGERIPGGRYRVGIACSYFGTTAKYWDTEIVITVSSGDGSGGVTWRLANEPQNAGRPDQGSGRWVIATVGGLSAAALGWYVWQRRARWVITLSKEQQ